MLLTRTSILILTIAWSGSASAVNCPMPHPKYFELITKIDQFSQAVKKGPQCQSLSTELTDLKVLYSKSDRKLIERAAEVVAGEKKELSPEEITQVKVYSEQITTKLGSIVSSLRNQPNCLPGKKTSVLASIAGITSEVASLSSSFEGPYKIPIQTAGAAVSGVLLGIDAVLKKSMDSYDFSQSEDRILFMTQLCTYDGIREEIHYYSEPEPLIQEYERLRSKLMEKRSLLIKSHETSRLYDSMYELKRASHEAVASYTSALRKVEADSALETVWDRCMHVAEMTHQSGEIQKIAEVTDHPAVKVFFDAQKDYCPRALLNVALSPQGIPNATQCLSESDPEKLQAKNQRSLSILREILKSYDAGLSAAAAALKKEAQKDVPIYDYNPVEWLMSTHAKQEWVAVEIPAFEKLASNSSYTARREVADRKDYLDTRLFEQLGPKFVDWYVDDTRKNLAAFERQAAKKLRKLDRRFTDDGNPAQGWNTFLKQMMSGQPATTHSTVFYTIESLSDDLAKATYSLGSVNAYCDYLSKHGALSLKLSKNCLNAGLRRSDQKFFQFAEMVKAFKGYAEYCFQNKHVNRTSSAALVERIEACTRDIGVPVENRRRN